MTCPRLRIKQLHLSSIRAENIANLITDSLRCSDSDAKALSEEVFAKTRGNPFFVHRLLTTLHKTQNLIRYDFERAQWVWNIDAIKAAPIISANGDGEDVVTFLVEELQRLPAPTQELLTLASFLGGNFSVNDLCAVMRSSNTPTDSASLGSSLRFPSPFTSSASASASPSASASASASAARPPKSASSSSITVQFITPAVIHSRLRAAIDSGLLTFSTVQHYDYRFVHDYVQQAAKQLIPSAQHPALHLRIGQMLLRQWKVEQEKSISPLTPSARSVADSPNALPPAFRTSVPAPSTLASSPYASASSPSAGLTTSLLPPASDSASAATPTASTQPYVRPAPSPYALFRLLPSAASSPSSPSVVDGERSLNSGTSSLPPPSTESKHARVLGAASVSPALASAIPSTTSTFTSTASATTPRLSSAHSGSGSSAFSSPAPSLAPHTQRTLRPSASALPDLTSADLERSERVFDIVTHICIGLSLLSTAPDPPIAVHPVSSPQSLSEAASAVMGMSDGDGEVATVTALPAAGAVPLSVLSEADRLELARLCHFVCEKLVRSSSYQTAFKYAQAGMHLLMSACLGAPLSKTPLDIASPQASEAAFRCHYRLAFSLYLAVAKTAYLAHNHHQTCGRLCDVALRHVTGIEDRYIAMRYRTSKLMFRIRFLYRCS
jgi:hypothetical protein